MILNSKWSYLMQIDIDFYWLPAPVWLKVLRGAGVAFLLLVYLWRRKQK